MIREYSVLTLGVLRLVKDGKTPQVAGRHAKKWLQVTRGTALAGRAWFSYRLSLLRQRPDELSKPTASDVVPDLESALFGLRRATLILYSSTFEQFAQCWALNYLLARLEAGLEWTRAHGNLAIGFFPVSAHEDLPGLPRIMQAIPCLEDGVSKLPTFVTFVDSDSEMPAPVEPEYNALKGIRFWRAVRNQAVHRNGVLSSAFARRHGPFIERLREQYPYMDPAADWNRIRLYDDVVRAMFVVHYRVAQWMSNELEAVSSGRRGHPNAPGPRAEATFVAGEVNSPPMLIPSDHPLSYQRTVDSSLRTRILAAAAVMPKHEGRSSLR
jgi:hypothetical protein